MFLVLSSTEESQIFDRTLFFWPHHHPPEPQIGDQTHAYSLDQTSKFAMLKYLRTIDGELWIDLVADVMESAETCGLCALSLARGGLTHLIRSGRRVVH